jgi:hypothetical protein
VRYQAHALADCQVSPVILADIVQTLPDRTLSVVRTSDGTFKLTLSGPTYTSIRGGAAPVRDDPAVLARVTAHLEERDARIVDDLLGWREIPASEVTLTASVGDSVTTWQGNVTISHGAAARRVVIIEEDWLTMDPPEIKLAPRVIYADILDL